MTSRIDPDRWPDRFALERHARALRRAEIDRLARVFAAWARTLYARMVSKPRHAPARRHASAH